MHHTPDEHPARTDYILMVINLPLPLQPRWKHPGKLQGG